MNVPYDYIVCEPPRLAGIPRTLAIWLGSVGVVGIFPAFFIIGFMGFIGWIIIMVLVYGAIFQFAATDPDATQQYMFRMYSRFYCSWPFFFLNPDRSKMKDRHWFIINP
jgi:hypothetical protein